VVYFVINYIADIYVGLLVGVGHRLAFCYTPRPVVPAKWSSSWKFCRPLVGCCSAFVVVMPLTLCCLSIMAAKARGIEPPLREIPSTRGDPLLGHEDHGDGHFTTASRKWRSGRSTEMLYFHAKEPDVSNRAISRKARSMPTRP